MICYSIIVPHYDDAERLERLLKSMPVVRKDVEVIVVDDCTPEQGALSAVRIRWPQVRWLSTPENGGAGVARNVGLDAAKGRWLVFADADDEFMPSAFEHFDGVLREDDELVFFLAEAVQELDGSSSASADQMNSLVRDCGAAPDAHNVEYLRLHHVVPWAKVYSRAFVDSIGVRFDPVRFSNDIAFNVLAAVQAQRVRTEPLTVYRYYRRPGSLTTELNAEAFLLRFEQARSLAERLAQRGFNKVRPATGHMLRSLKYGPRLASRVWLQAIRSPMRIDWLRLFQPNRWARFWSWRRAEVREHGRLQRGTKPSCSVSNGPM